MTIHSSSGGFVDCLKESQICISGNALWLIDLICVIVFNFFFFDVNIFANTVSLILEKSVLMVIKDPMSSNLSDTKQILMAVI